MYSTKYQNKVYINQFQSLVVTFNLDVLIECIKLTDKRTSDKNKLRSTIFANFTSNLSMLKKLSKIPASVKLNEYLRFLLYGS